VPNKMGISEAVQDRTKVTIND